MLVNLNELYNKRFILVDSKIDIDVKDDSLGIKRLEDLCLKGKISYNELDELELNLNLSGTMYLLDAISLEEVPYHFQTDIEESLAENEINLEKYIDKNQNILDIREILWENIVLEVPIRVRKDNEDVTLEGEGWQLNKEKEEEIDPRLAKLTELLKAGKE